MNSLKEVLMHSLKEVLGALAKGSARCLAKESAGIHPHSTLPANPRRDFFMTPAACFACVGICIPDSCRDAQIATLEKIPREPCRSETRCKPNQAILPEAPRCVGNVRANATDDRSAYGHSLFVVLSRSPISFALASGR